MFLQEVGCKNTEKESTRIKNNCCVLGNFIFSITELNSGHILTKHLGWGGVNTKQPFSTLFENLTDEANALCNKIFDHFTLFDDIFRRIQLYTSVVSLMLFSEICQNVSKIVEWFKSCLSNRMQYVDNNANISSPLSQKIDFSLLYGNILQAKYVIVYMLL